MIACVTVFSTRLIKTLVCTNKQESDIIEQFKRMYPNSDPFIEIITCTDSAVLPKEEYHMIVNM